MAFRDFVQFKNALSQINTSSFNTLISMSQMYSLPTTDQIAYSVGITLGCINFLALDFTLDGLLLAVF